MKARRLVLIALFAALTAVGAFLRIPTPVSTFSLQFFFTAMAGVLLGKRDGAISQLIYVLVGLCGLPVFTAGGGISYLTHSTFGFLIGLIPAAWLIGFMTEKRGFSFWSIVLACSAGLGVLYVVGLPYMHIILTVYLRREWSLWQTILSGMLIFLPWDALKIIATAVIGNRVAPRIKNL